MRNLLAAWLASLAFLACAPEPRERAGHLGLLDGVEIDRPATPRAVSIKSLELDLNRLGRQARFETVDADTVRTPRGVAIRPTGEHASLTVELLSIRRAVDTIRLELRMNPGAKVDLFWAGEGDDFSGDRKKRFTVPASDELVPVEVDLWEEVIPTTRLRRLRLRPVEPAAMEVGHIVLERRVRLPDSEPPQGAAGKVRLGHDIRAAAVVSQLRPLAQPIAIAPGDRLAFALAPSRELPAPVRLTVDWESDGRREPIFSERIDAAGWDRWSPRSVPLDSVSGEGLLRFAVSTDEPVEREAIVFVAHPRVLGSRPPEDRPNIVLVSVDTLGAKRLEEALERDQVPSFFRPLEERSTRFSASVSAASLTHQSHASLLTGRLPLNTRFLWLDGSVGGIATVASRLRDLGYATEAITAGVMVNDSFGFDRGFETFYRHDTLYRDEDDRTDIAALVDRAVEWLAAGPPEPFFLFFHTYEVHTPFFERGMAAEPGEPPAEPRYWEMRHMRGRLPIPEEELRDFVFPGGKDPSGKARKTEVLSGGVTGEELVGRARAAHRSEIRYLDRELGRLLAALDDLRVSAGTAIIVTADHGEAFYEHGLLQHGLLYQENLRVPLMLSLPGREPAREPVTQWVGSVDVAATIVDLAGGGSPPDLDGRSLLPLVDSRGAATPGDRYAFVLGNGFAWYWQGRFKLLLRAALIQENFGRVELFDLAADPEERVELIARGEALPSGLARWVEETIDAMPGAHLDLGRLAPGEYDLVLPSSVGYRHRLYGFDFDILERRSTPNAISLRVRLGPRSRLVLLDNGAVWRVPLVLTPAGGASSRFDILPTTLPAEAARLEPAEGPPLPLFASLRRQEGGGDEGGISEEEEQQLRSLGYIQ